MRALILFILVLIFIPLECGCGLFYEFSPVDNLDKIEDEIESVKDNHRVTEVIDGDTVIVSGGERIRLLGINAPEEGMYFYSESADVLEMMLMDKDLRLEKDISDRDIYGRSLRYIFMDDLFVNLEMVKRGFANAYTYPPDVKYAEDILAAERYARENNLGLWELSDIDSIKTELVYDAPGDDNKNINGEYVIIENTGECVLNTRGWTIKDSGTNIYSFDSLDILPGSSIILFSGKGEDCGDKLYWNSPTPVWNNDSDTLYLRSREGLLIDLYSY
jgi:endonuclease YncB( thermonuclease family)